MAKTASLLKLTVQEVSFLKTFLDRETFRILRLSNREQASKENTAAVNLGVKITSSMLTVNRVEVKILQRIIDSYILMTRTMTLPEYDRRIHERPEAKDQYQPYIEKHEAELDLCEGLLTKVEKLL